MTEVSPEFSSLETLIQLGELMPGGLFLYRADETQELLYANGATLRIFGCKDLDEFKALTGYTFRGLVHPEDFDEIQSSIDQQIQDAANGKEDFVKYRIVRKDGEVRWLSDYGRLTTLPGYGEVYTVFITDDTQRLREREERERTELALARERHEHEIKSAFLFNMSHDLRTPMNAMLGFTELARRNLTKPERAAEYLDKTLTAGTQLNELIEDLLEMNNLEGENVALNYEPCDLRVQLSMALDLFRIAAADKRLRLVEDVDLPDEQVLVDQSRFRRVISNLLSNAVKFTPEGGTVTLSARKNEVSESGYARYAFTVADTGPGIPAHMEARLFESFTRGGSSTQTGKTGTGLGLSIVRSILDRMGGTVRVDSRPGEGAAFTVELPLKLVREGCGEAPSRTESPSRNERRILIVEDVEFNRELLESLLEDEGFVTEAVPDGCDAVEAVKTHPAGYYGLILMDIQMPVMNGYEATRAIRSLPREDVQALPILALSANSLPEDRRKSAECGMNEHIAKPFDIDDLVERINSYLENE